MKGPINRHPITLNAQGSMILQIRHFPQDQDEGSKEGQGSRKNGSNVKPNPYNLSTAVERIRYK
jgi:hypothetical protein